MMAISAVKVVVAYGGETFDGLDWRRPPPLRYKHQLNRIVMPCNRSDTECYCRGHEGSAQQCEHDVAQ
jgi:hypothetical protein